MTTEDAIKWIEEEVYKNGVFKVELEMVEMMERNKPVMDQHGTVTIAERVQSMNPTGRFEGFTCSSQRVHGRNLMQLVVAMERESKQRECVHVWKEEYSPLTNSKIFTCNLCEKMRVQNEMAQPTPP